MPSGYHWWFIFWYLAIYGFILLLAWPFLFVLYIWIKRITGPK